MSLDHFTKETAVTTATIRRHGRKPAAETTHGSYEHMDATNTNQPIRRIKLSQIKRTAQTRTAQTRAGTRDKAVSEYAEVLADKDADLTPADVFLVNGQVVMSSGYHRYEAYEKAGRDDMPCILRPGSMWDAIRHGISDNLGHVGERVTTADKRAAVRMALLYGHQNTDRVIGDLCGVDHKTVGARRQEMKEAGEIPHLTDRVGQDGKTYAVPQRPQPTPKPDADDVQEPEAAQGESQADSEPAATLDERAEERIADTVSVGSVPEPVVPPGPLPKTKTCEELVSDALVALRPFNRAVDKLEPQDKPRYEKLRYFIKAIENLLEDPNQEPSATKAEAIAVCEAGRCQLVTGLDRLKAFDQPRGVKGIELAIQVDKLLQAARTEF